MKQTLTTKYRPLDFDSFVGLGPARRLMGQLAAEPYESAWLFVGDSGTGKTSLALATHAAMGGQLHHIPSRKCDMPTVESTISKCYYVPMLGGWHTVVVDEADQMTPAAQLLFLSALDETERPPSTIFFFTCNDVRRLERRFRSRCKPVTFDATQLEADGAAHLAKIWEAECGGLPPDFGQIMRMVGNNLRSAINVLELELMEPGSGLHKPPYTMGDWREERPARGNVIQMGDLAERRSAAAMKAWETRRKMKRRRRHA